MEGICGVYFPCTVYNVQKIKQIPQYVLCIATSAINFANIYTTFPSIGGVDDVTARKKIF